MISRRQMTKRMLIMLLVVGLIFGAIFGFQAFKSKMIKQYMANNRPPPAVVTTARAELATWQPRLDTIGTLRAMRGVDVTTEIPGLVRSLSFRSGQEVRAGTPLVQLNADADVAQLRSLEAAAELADTVYQRDKAQFEAGAIARAVLDADAADLKSKRALVAQQQAAIAKKTIRAPFAGRLGITTINPGQYLNPGDKIVTLQAIHPIYVDFTLPQQELARLAVGQRVVAKSDAFPGKSFAGRINSIDPRVDPATRNVAIQATLANPLRELLPGMFAQVAVSAGATRRYLTLPQTAVTFNPYGATVYTLEEGKGPDGKAVLTARQTFVTTGPTRGDQVAILSGIKAGDTVVTSGQLKLKNGAEVTVNNKVQPSNDPAPRPVDR